MLLVGLYTQAYECHDRLNCLLLQMSLVIMWKVIIQWVMNIYIPPSQPLRALWLVVHAGGGYKYLGELLGSSLASQTLPWAGCVLSFWFSQPAAWGGLLLDERPGFVGLKFDAVPLEGEWRRGPGSLGLKARPTSLMERETKVKLSPFVV